MRTCERGCNVINLYLFCEIMPLILIYLDHVTQPLKKDPGNSKKLHHLGRYNVPYIGFLISNMIMIISVQCQFKCSMIFFLLHSLNNPSPVTKVYPISFLLNQLVLHIPAITQFGQS